MSVLSKCRYVILSDQPSVVQDLLVFSKEFTDFQFIGTAASLPEAIDLVIEQKPALIFLEISSQYGRASLSLHLLTDLRRYLNTLPKVVLLANDMHYALDAIHHEVFDFIALPLRRVDVQKALLKYRKSQGIQLLPLGTTVHLNGTAHDFKGVLNDEGASQEIQDSYNQNLNPDERLDQEIEPQEFDADESLIEVKRSENLDREKPLVICVKSYGDYRFINANDIGYLKADNNSTDIHLVNGEMITAFKTLKHFEQVLQTPFVRIHNSYIVNIDFVSRIHTGNSACYLKHNGVKLPFSKSYKENVDAILLNITKGNYLEI